MTDSTIRSLVETRKRIVLQVNKGELSVKDAAKLLGDNPARVMEAKERT